MPDGTCQPQVNPGSIAGRDKTRIILKLNRIFSISHFLFFFHHPHSLLGQNVSFAR